MFLLFTRSLLPVWSLIQPILGNSSFRETFAESSTLLNHSAVPWITSLNVIGPQL